MLSIRSEVGRLRRVLVHAPGPEVDRMVPSMMGELLFDDLLFGERAREEHAVFRAVLERLGVEILDAGDLLRDVLGIEEARAWLLESLLEDLPRPLRERILAASPAESAMCIVEGVRFDPEAGGIEADDLFEITPIPNWCFQRDPQIVIGDGVVFASMAAPGRWREGMLAGAIFRFHPSLADATVLHDPMQSREGRPIHLGLDRASLEGGDVLILSPEIVLIGFSERTNRAGIRNLARALCRREDGPRWMLVVDLPPRRAFMHLDTVLTPIAPGECLAYTPILETGHPAVCDVYAIDLHETDPHPRFVGDLQGALGAKGQPVDLIPCGGDDPIRQQREQWTDGANALAVAPGKILLYERNVATADALRKKGYTIIGADALLAAGSIDTGNAGKICVLLPSFELSRARGGPHCLSHALVRDPIA